MPSFRQILAVTLVWALMAWLTAVGLRAGERGWGEAMTWYYSLRAPLVAVGLGLLAAPLLCRDLGGGWVHLQFPRRARLARALLWAVQGVTVGLIIGTSGTFLVLFLWPNDMQSHWMDALKWCGFYWQNHTVLFGSATVVGGLGSSWLGRRLGG